MLNGAGSSANLLRRVTDELVAPNGGVLRLLNEYESKDAARAESAKEVLRHIVSVAVDNRTPLPPPYSKYNAADFEARFVNDICAKLRPTLRKLVEATPDVARLETNFLRAVQRQVERSRRVFLAKYESGAAPLLAEEEDRHSSSRNRAREEIRTAAECFRPVLDGRWTPPHTVELLKYLEAWAEEPVADASPLDDDGVLDAGALAERLGLTPREVQRIIRVVRKEGSPVREQPPRQFRKVHKRLMKFASEPWGSLADAELREEIFRLSRDLAFSFGPHDAIAKGARMLDRGEFSGAVNTLLDERAFTEALEQRTVLERQMQTILRICEAFEASNLNEAFKLSGVFLLDAARIQHHTSPERLQTLLAYTHLLQLGKQYEAYVDASRAIADRVNDIVALKGAGELDEAAEFEHAVPLRRIRTYARVNEISCLFNHVLTTASTNVFRAPNYEALRELAQGLRDVIADDPQAVTVHDELLVIQAHVYRAAYNRFRDRQKTDHEYWRVERDTQRRLLSDTIDAYFFDVRRPIPDGARLMDAAHAAEGGAVDRVLDVLDQVLNAYPSVLQELRQERLAQLHVSRSE